LNNFDKRTDDEGATTSGGAETSTAAAAVASKLSRSEINVLKTMFIIIIGFVVCWSVQSFSFLLIQLKVSQISVLLVIFVADGRAPFWNRANEQICDKLLAYVSFI